MASTTRSDDAWFALAASARGSSHEIAGTPNQDAVATSSDSVRAGTPIAIAVADGHGDRRHFRSDRGAQFATTSACFTASALATDLEACVDARAASELLRTAFVPHVLTRWEALVRADNVSFPFDSTEQELIHPGDAYTIPYGTTLLLAMVTRRWLGMAQIGDGDIVLIDQRGRATLPLPPDPSADGLRTTSLCSPGASCLARCAIIDLSSHPVSVVLAATDGFGNAQSEDRWYGGVGRDIADLLVEHGVPWLNEHLAIWAARCASSEGSGDDTSLAMLVRRLHANGPLTV